MPTPKFTAVEDKPGWSRADIVVDSYAAQEMARTLNAKRPAHTCFVCGALPDDGPHSLYRIETRDPLDITRDFQVGTHAELSYGEDAHPAGLEQMAMVHARKPIVPFFADDAGLKCTFEQPLREDFAEYLESVITEGVEAYADEGYIAPVVMREGVLRLWWD
jgi:hypothetical protein